jgi:uncharacterized membrane protein
MQEPLATKISRWGLSGFFVFAGVMHFLRPDWFLRAMPPYIPFPLEMVFVSGVFEILGGVGIQVNSMRKVAGYGLIALLVAVFPVNIHMAIHSEDFPQFPAAGLYIRLLFQPLFCLWVWRSAIRQSST